jgi:hypothetical protein
MRRSRFLPRPPLSRRTLLRGGGYALALPWLQAMTPRRAQAAAPPRALFLYFPSGYTAGAWITGGTPGVATDFTLPAVARALAPWQRKLTLITNLANQPATEFGNDAGGLHARGTGCSLVCAPLRKDGFAGAGVSVDQLIARALDGQGQGCISSLVLGVPNERTPSFAEEGYSSIYYNNVSFTGPRSPVQKVSNPADLFLRLVTCPGFGAGPGEKRARFEQALMSGVKDQASRLMKCAGQADRVRLEEYFTSVTELERRFVPAIPAACPGRSQAPAPGTTLAEGANAMMDLAVLAFQCGLARVGTLMMDGAFSRRSFGLPDINGVNYIHGLSHGEIGGEAADNPRWLKITSHYFQLFAGFLAKLDAVPDVAGTLLDSTLVSIGSEFGDGNRHQCSDLPLVLAGGGGRVQLGRHITAAKDTPIANVFLTVLHALGIDQPTFGNSSGELPGLRP